MTDIPFIARLGDAIEAAIAEPPERYWATRARLPWS